MTSTSQPIRFEQPRAIDVEDQARADFYALLASIFFRAPDERLLRAITIAPKPTSESALGDAMAKAWAALAAASAAVTPDAVQEEFDKLFGGVGRAQLMPYGSYYQAGFLNEKPLAELRSDLAHMGFSRDTAASETEDHLAALCDVMRAMILGDIASLPATLAAQQQFFKKHLQPWVVQCCDATINNENSNYYKSVAAFARSFFEIEIQAFDMQ